MVRQKPKRTFLQAAKAVLEETKQPMHFKKITEVALQKGYLRTTGKTPEWTMGARLSVDVKRRGAESDFLRVGNGRYGLRVWKRRGRALKPADVEGDSPSYWLVSVQRENFEADLASGRFDTVGVKPRMLKTLESLNKGDIILLFIKRVAQFGAILEVNGAAYVDDSPRWPVLSKELSARISCRPLLVLRSERVDARPLYDKLEVFTQYPAKHRTLALRNGITEISRRDFAIIERALRRIAGDS
jgi:hypothetical protein